MELKNSTAVGREVYIEVLAGQIAEIVDQLYAQCMAQGYSLLKEDVEQCMIEEVQYYASRCAVLEHQRKALQSFNIDLTTPLTGDEWAVIDPVVRARFDLIQARLMEGSNSLMNGQAFGLGVSEALATYTQQRANMQIEGFVEPPFSFSTLSGL